MPTVTRTALWATTEEHTERETKGEPGSPGYAGAEWHMVPRRVRYYEPIRYETHASGGVPNMNRWGRFSRAEQRLLWYYGINENPVNPAVRGVSCYQVNWEGIGGAHGHFPAGGFGVGTAHSPGEGYGAMYMNIVFKDLGIPRGATIHSATLELHNIGTIVVGTTYSTVGPPPAGGWRYKIYAVDEDNVRPFQYLGKGDPHNYHGFYGWTLANDRLRWIDKRAYRRHPRMYQIESWEEDREHTRAEVLWIHTGTIGNNTTFPFTPGSYVYDGAPGDYTAVKWTAPDISPVIQEIVNRPGWQPNNRMCISLGNDSMTPDADSMDKWLSGSMGLSGEWKLWVFLGVNFVNPMYHPRLIVSYS